MNLWPWTPYWSLFFVNLKPVEISKNYTNVIWTSSKIIMILKIWRVWLKNWACHTLLNFEIQMDTIWTSIITTYFTKETGVWLKNWSYHVHLNFKIEKGMAGSIFEPHPPNFQNQDNFWKWSNDITMIFWYLCWFKIFKKSGKQGVQMIPEVHFHHLFD